MQGHALLLRARRSDFRFPTEAPGQPAVVLWRSLRMGGRSVVVLTRAPEEILDEVGQPVADVFPDGVAAPTEEQVREFRRFLDDVGPNDFADPPPSS